jgi:hypothetical protein
MNHGSSSRANFIHLKPQPQNQHPWCARIKSPPWCACTTTTATKTTTTTSLLGFTTVNNVERLLRTTKRPVGGYINCSAAMTIIGYWSVRLLLLLVARFVCFVLFDCFDCLTAPPKILPWLLLLLLSLLLVVATTHRQ